MKKQIIATLTACLSLAGLSSCGTQETEVLFDGSNLDRWEITGKAKVQSNVLQLAGPQTRLLLKDGDYTDFELHLQARTVDGGKGSVAFHTDASGKGYAVAQNGQPALRAQRGEKPRERR